MAHFFSFLSKHSWPKRIPFSLAMNVSNVSFFEDPLVFLTQIRERGGGCHTIKFKRGSKRSLFHKKVRKGSFS